MDHLPQPVARTRALLRAREIVSPYPEGVSIGEEDRLSARPPYPRLPRHLPAAV